MADSRDTRALRKRLDRMRHDRVEGLRAQTRRGLALDLLDAEGQVTTESLDARMAAVWTEPDDVTIANLLAQKTRASVEHERAEVESAESAVTRADERVEKMRARLADAEQAAENARGLLADTRERLGLAESLAELAGGQGNADAAPAGESVRVEPTPATNNTTSGG